MAILILMSSCNQQSEYAPNENNSADRETQEKIKASGDFRQKAGFIDAFAEANEKGDWRVLHKFYQEATNNIVINANEHFDKLRQVCVQEIILAGLCKEKGKNELLLQEYYFYEMMKCKYQSPKVAYMLLTAFEDRWGKEKVHTYAQKVYTKNEKSYLKQSKRASDAKEVDMHSNIMKEVAVYVKKLKAL